MNDFAFDGSLAVEAEHPEWKGNCGDRVNFAVGDLFTCYDRHIKRDTKCVMVAAYEYHCCLNQSGVCLRDDSEMRSWSFY